MLGMRAHALVSVCYGLGLTLLVCYCIPVCARNESSFSLCPCAKGEGSLSLRVIHMYELGMRPRPLCACVLGVRADSLYVLHVLGMRAHPLYVLG